MNFRHATALALVGWYLMMQPGTKGCPEGAPCPMSIWDVWGVYDSASECMKAQQALVVTARNAETVPSADTGQARNMINATTRCLASDDPRLK